MKGKKIVVTGGEGFVGSSLIASLRHNNEIISIDNGINKQRRERYANVVYHASEASLIADLIEGLDVDIIFHLGEYSRVEASFGKVDLILQNNFKQFFDVCTAAANVNAKLVYSASSTIFAKEETGYEPSPYQVFKRHNVEFLRDFARFKKLDYAITYFYNVYGPGEVCEGEFATVVGKFLSLAKQGLPLEVTRPGNQRRNFTHISDIVRGLITIGEMGSGDGYGIGADESYSIIELAQLISKNIRYSEEKRGNRIDSGLTVNKTRDLGWSAKCDLKRYIAEELKNANL